MIVETESRKITPLSRVANVKGQTFGPGTIAGATWLKFSPDVSFEEWKAVGVRLGRVSNASLWWLADWLFYGQWEWGKRYEEATASTGLADSTLRNYASVAGKFQLSRRRDKLSFAHHAEVASFSPSEADAWLDRAEAEGWSLHEFRLGLQGEQEPKQIGFSMRLSVSMQRDEQEIWTSHAEQEGLDLVEWTRQNNNRRVAEAAA